MASTQSYRHHTYMYPFTRNQPFRTAGHTRFFEQLVLTTDSCSSLLFYHTTLKFYLGSSIEIGQYFYFVSVFQLKKKKRKNEKSLVVLETNLTWVRGARLVSKQFFGSRNLSHILYIHSNTI